MSTEILKTADSQNLAKRTRRFFRRLVASLNVVLVATSVYCFAMSWIEVSSGSPVVASYFGIGFLICTSVVIGLRHLDV